MNEETIPRIHTDHVQGILKQNIIRKEKAIKIYRYNHEMCSLESDGKLPYIMDANTIEKLLKEQGY